MRHFLISALFLSLVAGCSSVNIGPHRIDVQQGNALDQENVARLKPGLNRSQVRFLLGTPLVVDPFRTDRWDYVYVLYKAGKLAEQKHITLFFEGDTLARIEGDLPAPTPASEPKPEPQPAPVMPAVPAAAEPAAAVSAGPEQVAVMAAPEVRVTPVVAPTPAPVAPAAVATVAASQSSPAAPAESTVVPPLPSPEGAPPYVDPRTTSALRLQTETNVEQVKPDVMPAFPESPAAGDGDAPVLQSVNEWAAAWARRDASAYLAAYDERFVPADGRSRADWEKRKRQALAAAKPTEIKVDSPWVERSEEGTAAVTFRQISGTGSHRNVVTKQLLLIERDGRWLIVEEKVLPGGVRP
jgi:outer membrane protein assembly factor BamE